MSDETEDIDEFRLSAAIHECPMCNYKGDFRYHHENICFQNQIDELRRNILDLKEKNSECLSQEKTKNDLLYTEQEWSFRHDLNRLEIKVYNIAPHQIDLEIKKELLIHIRGLKYEFHNFRK